MAEQEGGEPHTPGDPLRPAPPTHGSPAAKELAEALGALDRATRTFTRRLGEGQLEVERARLAGEQAIHEAGSVAGSEARVEPIAAPRPAVADGADPPAAFDRSMREAEAEAKAYLEAAKRRADSLVSSMVAAVEHEAAQARREAEVGIRARWQQVEVEADRHIENAHLIASRMVAERQTRIAGLADGISNRAEALTAGMDDAERVRAQFGAFVSALAATAERIAHERAPAATQRPGRPDAMAA